MTQVTPATITVEIVKIFDHPDPEHAGTLIEIDILVSLSKSRKLKWKSQPLTLSIEPRVHPDRQAAFTTQTHLKFMLMPPELPTFIPIAAKSTKSSVLKLVALPDRVLTVTENGGLSLPDDSGDEVITELNASLTLAGLYLVGEAEKVRVNGADIDLRQVEPGSPSIFVCDELRLLKSGPYVTRVVRLSFL